VTGVQNFKYSIA